MRRTPSSCTATSRRRTTDSGARGGQSGAAQSRGGAQNAGGAAGGSKANGAGGADATKKKGLGTGGKLAVVKQLELLAQAKPNELADPTEQPLALRAAYGNELDYSGACSAPAKSRPPNTSKH